MREKPVFHLLRLHGLSFIKIISEVIVIGEGSTHNLSFHSSFPALPLFTRLVYTGLIGELEHLKIKRRLMDEKFPSVMGEYLFLRTIKVKINFFFP